MPIYEYMCEDCGPFEETASIDRFTDPCDCPACGASAQRNLLSVPQLSRLTSQARSAHAVNERSADSPKRAKANGLKPTGPKIRSKARIRPDGTKSLAGARPWMLSH